MITLNNVIKNLNNIADAHSQINSFFYGEMYDFAASGATQYPAMAVESVPNVYQKTVLIRSFNIYMMDLVTKDIRNRQEVLSDMEQNCFDVLALLDRDTRYEWNINLDNIVLNDFVDTFDQEVSGYWFKLDMRIINPLDRCQVPLVAPLSVFAETLEKSIDACSYIITVKTDNDGTSADTQFTMSLGSGSYVNAVFEWGDGKADVITSWNQNELEHTYSQAGTYTIKAFGAIEDVRFNLGGDVEKIIELSQWGTTKVSSFQTSYRGAVNMVISATDTPNMSTVTDLSFMLQNAAKANPYTKDWPAQNITTLSNFCRNATIANPDITGEFWQQAQIAIWDNAFWFSAFNRDLTDLDFTATTSMIQTFDDSDLSTDNYDKLLLALDRDGVSSCPIGASSSNYTISVSGTARGNLVGRGCTITDAGGI